MNLSIKRLSIVFSILTLVLLSTISGAQINPKALAEKKQENTKSPIFHPHDSDNDFSKEIIMPNGTSTTYYRMVVNTTFQIRLTLENSFNETIYNVTLNCPENNVTTINPEYQNDWFTFNGIDRNWSAVLWESISPGDSKNFTFQVTPHHLYNYTFSGTTAIYNFVNETSRSVTSNDIYFEVYEEPPQIKVEKKLVAAEDEEPVDDRVAVDRNVSVQITVTNLLYQQVNVSINDVAPGNVTAFNFTVSQLSANTSYLAINQSYSYSYEIQALQEGVYVLQEAEVVVTLMNTTKKYFISNTVTITVYTPLYDGDDWRKKVPLITVQKTLITQDGEYLKTIEMRNDSIELVTIQINITNRGSVTASNITVEEQVYREWVFITDGVENWSIIELKTNESYVFNYTIIPKILGNFKIEPTAVNYNYINQRTLLPEENHKVYFNLLEISIIYVEEEPNKSLQWWATIGMSFGVVVLAVVPFIITIYLYRNRRRTQKGT
jgi:hypothetical protein